MLNERFVKEVEKEIKELVGEKYDVRFSEIQKNNGLILHGVSICPKDKNVAPTIYLENYLGKELSVKRMAESVIEDALCHMKEGDVAVSTDMGTPESLSEMVKEVNGTEVSAEEQLSDNVYLFERETASLKLA